MQSTIKIYEKSETSELQLLLNQYEQKIENSEILIERFGDRLKDEDYQKIQNAIVDCEIDTHLIRMELNKRLWRSNKKK